MSHLSNLNNAICKTLAEEKTPDLSKDDWLFITSCLAYLSVGELMNTDIRAFTRLLEGGVFFERSRSEVNKEEN